jgi:secondary thiamine-phosphate synthase enzyme
MTLRNLLIELSLSLQTSLTLPAFSGEFHLITDLVNEAIDLPKTGVLHIFIQHTSAGLTINENADPTVQTDLEVLFNHKIKENEPFYQHTYEGPDDMHCINLLAEACGVDGGEIYLFNEDGRLKPAITVSKVVDGGVFWFSENLTFPDDERTYIEDVYYERELGQSIDEELQITRAVIYNIVLKWEDGKFTPDVSEYNFDEE